MTRKIVILIVVVVAVTALAVFWHWTIVHLSQQTGTSNSASRAYDYWSGFGSVIPWSLGIVAGVIVAYRHHTCHVRGCPWLGQKVEGTPYIACPKHHPAHHGDKRGVSVDHIHEAHAAAKEPA